MSSNHGLALLYIFFSPKWDKKWRNLCPSCQSVRKKLSYLYPTLGDSEVSFTMQYVQVCSKGLRISFICNTKQEFQNPLKEVTCDCDMSVIHIFTFTIPDYTPFQIFMHSGFPCIFPSFYRLDLNNINLRTKNKLSHL